MKKTLTIPLALTVTAYAQATPTYSPRKLDLRTGAMNAARAGATAKSMAKALDLYHKDCASYPTTEMGLQALLTKPEKGCEAWGPDAYIPRLPMDPWGRPWHYKSEGKTFELSSLGEDGREGGVGSDRDINYTAPQEKP